MESWTNFYLFTIFSPLDFRDQICQFFLTISDGGVGSGRRHRRRRRSARNETQKWRTEYTQLSLQGIANFKGCMLQWFSIRVNSKNIQ